MLFSDFHLLEREIITPIVGTVFCADFGALIYAQILRRFFAQILCADFVGRFFVRNAQIFAQIFRRFFFGILVLQKQVFQSHAKIRAKSAEKSAASQGPVPGRGPYSIFAALSRRHVTQ